MACPRALRGQHLLELDAELWLEPGERRPDLHADMSHWYAVQGRWSAARWAWMHLHDGTPLDFLQRAMRERRALVAARGRVVR